jgi:hypothetical protein
LYSLSKVPPVTSTLIVTGSGFMVQGSGFVPGSGFWVRGQFDVFVP